MYKFGTLFERSLNLLDKVEGRNQEYIKLSCISLERATPSPTLRR